MSQSVKIPVSEYEMLITTGACTAAARAALERFLEQTGYARILLFGASTTGEAVKEVIGERFAGFVDSATVGDARKDDGDCLLICTSPVHLEEVEKTIRSSALSEVPLFRLFGDDPLNIRLIMETQPRCGTGYVMSNLCQALGLGYASVFRVSGGKTSSDGLVRYSSDACAGHVVKAHFTKTLHYPQYRYVPKLFLIGYFYDTYYRWARMVSGIDPEHRDEYYLSADSPEWKRVKGYIPLHLQWLEYIKSRDYIRYEDFYTDFDRAMDVFARLLGEYPSGFERPRMIGSRMYWTDEYAPLMDDAVYRSLSEAFSNHMAFYYPEKK